MKRFLFCILLSLGIVETVQAFDNCMTGSWYDPEISGSGINIEVLDSQVIAYYYRGAGETRDWFTMSGPRPEDDLVGLKFKEFTTGGNMVSGDAYIEILDTNTIQFGYVREFNFNELGSGIPWCIGCVGEFQYVRLTAPIPCD